MVYDECYRPRSTDVWSHVFDCIIPAGHIVVPRKGRLWQGVTTDAPSHWKLVSGDRRDVGWYLVSSEEYGEYDPSRWGRYGQKWLVRDAIQYAVETGEWHPDDIRRCLPYALADWLRERGKNAESDAVVQECRDSIAF